MSLVAANLYNALKLHFNSDKYDFFKYHGKTNIKMVTNSQLELFSILDKRYKKELQNFYLSNFLIDNKIWICNLLSDECDDNYVKWKDRNEKLTYLYKCDIIKLMEELTDTNDLFSIKNDYPLLLKKVFQEKISLETLLIMNSILKFFPTWSRNIKDDIIWPPFKKKCIKYYPFLNFDKDKMKQILKNEVVNKCNIM